jgi:hypothetical protein
VFYEVIPLRSGARKLRPEEWPEPEFGQISMATWKPGETSLARTARVATLYTNVGMMRRPALVLIEPRVTYLPMDGQVWEGTQLATTDEGMKEIPQAWLVRPTTKDSPPLPPFDVERWMKTRRAARDMPQPPVGKGWIKPERGRDRR